MKNSEDIFNEIKEISPYLANLRKENSFYASDEYFDKLSSRIQQKIINETKSQKTFRLLSYFKRPKWAAVASLVVILSISVIYYYNHKHNQLQSLVDNKTIYWDEILNENNAIIDKMDENMLVEILANENPDYNANLKKAVNVENKNIQQDLSNYIDTKYNNNDIFNEL
jgi:hypothetical protein